MRWRVDVIRRLSDMIKASPDPRFMGVGFLNEYLGQEHPRTSIAFMMMTGPMRIPTFGNAVKPIEDDWDLRVGIRTSEPGVTLVDAQERCADIANAIIDMLRANPLLNVPAPLAFHVSVRAEGWSLDGPDAGSLPDNSGWDSTALLVIPFNAKVPCGL
jgi:hypothetical protein